MAHRAVSLSGVFGAEWEGESWWDILRIVPSQGEICSFSAVAPKWGHFGWPQPDPQQDFPCLAAPRSTSQWSDAGSALEVRVSPEPSPLLPS